MSAHSHGFSLIELLFSTALVGILYILVLGPGSAIVQSKRKAQCAAQLHTMHQCLTLFAAEHDGAFPATPGALTSEAPLSQLVPLYTTDTTIFICPGSGDSALPGAVPFTAGKISYAYSMGLATTAEPTVLLASDAQAGTAWKRAGDDLFSSSGSGPGSNHRNYGGNVLFVDGHVETLPATASREFSFPSGVALLNPKP